MQARHVKRARMTNSVHNENEIIRHTSLNRNLHADKKLHISRSFHQQKKSHPHDIIPLNAVNAAHLLRLWQPSVIIKIFDCVKFHSKFNKPQNSQILDASQQNLFACSTKRAPSSIFKSIRPKNTQIFITIMNMNLYCLNVNFKSFIAFVAFSSSTRNSRKIVDKNSGKVKPRDELCNVTILRL